MNIYNVRMRLLPFLWFSMKLGMINSFLIVCFTMVQKNIQIREYLQNSCKISCNGYKTTFRKKNVLHLQSIQEKILPIIFLQFRLTKHFVDWVLADYNGYYIQGSSKSDKYGFFLVPA